MRLTKKKTEQILIDILSEEGLPLIKELWGKNNISEFDLAAKIKEDIKLVRKKLYLLYNHNLVAFTRKKDKQKGWYIYYWTLLPEGIRFNYFKSKNDLLERLNLLLEEESRELFFSCPNQCIRLNFDQAMDFEFHCPECGELIDQEDSQEKIKRLKKEIIQTTVELEKLKTQRYARRKLIRKRKRLIKTRKKTKKLKAQEGISFPSAQKRRKKGYPSLLRRRENYPFVRRSLFALKKLPTKSKKKK